MKVILCTVLFFNFATLVAMASVDSTESNERIMFLHSYPMGERGVQLSTGFKRVVHQRFPKADIKFVTLNYNSLLPVLVNFSWEKFRSNKDIVPRERKRLHDEILKYKPTVLVISDDEVAEVVHPLPKNAKMPIFVMGLNRPLRQTRWYKKNPSQYVGGIKDEKPMLSSLSFLRDMMSIKKIAIVTSNEMTSQFMVPPTVEAFKTYSKEQVRKFGKEAGLEIVDVVKSSDWSEWKERLKKNDDKLDLIWMLVPYQVYDKDGNEKKVSGIGKWLVEELDTPTVGISDVNVKVGALFAQASNTMALGRQLGEQVLGHLLSKGLQKIGFERRLGYDFFINRNTAERFDISIPKEKLNTLKVIYTADIIEKEGTK